MSNITLAVDGLVNYFKEVMSDKTKWCQKAYNPQEHRHSWEVLIPERCGRVEPAISMINWYRIVLEKEMIIMLIDWYFIFGCIWDGNFKHETGCHSVRFESGWSLSFCVKVHCTIVWTILICWSRMILLSKNVYH